MSTIDSCFCAGAHPVGRWVANRAGPHCTTSSTSARSAEVAVAAIQCRVWLGGGVAPNRRTSALARRRARSCISARCNRSRSGWGPGRSEVIPPATCIGRRNSHTDPEHRVARGQGARSRSSTRPQFRIQGASCSSVSSDGDSLPVPSLTSASLASAAHFQRR